ncbi:MAG: c-type cytochrome [Planctomycetes bacterium]|nr:c-type cytochrome [Planctomycetota bacterium]
MRLFAAFLLGCLACPATAFAQDPFAADIRPTPWRSPAEEQALLAVPDGFTLTCFVQEPAIWKPLNLAFDTRGRLWCTSSTEYPRPVGPERGFVGRDRITIHEDRDGDGVAETTTLFADDLNLPIGLLPVVDAEGHDGCLVFSVPDLVRLDDLDGDGRADRRTKLYGPFGWERDAHGLNNSFRRGADGWVYACHGYNNVTDVAGRDGALMHLESGNSYRFRLDGSRIEKFASGQVNPFGSAFDERGDLFTADCHTLPITLVLPGACYESFGAPHDGLGFGPTIMSHRHGSTALCGLAIESGGAFPPEYRGDLFVGNVMSGRVHRDRLEWRGSTPSAREQPDLITSEDPWFRPVDLQIGPDGALYVADFYNRIIGHYEVALDHPGRDRTSGRIWRVAPPGPRAAAPRLEPRLEPRTVAMHELLAALDHENLGVRRRALDLLCDRFGRDAEPELRRELLAWEQLAAAFASGAAADAAAPSARYAESLLFALLRVAPDSLAFLLPQLPRLPPLAVAQVLAALPATAGAGANEARAAESLVERIDDADPFVARAALLGLARAPTARALGPLVVELSRRIAAGDDRPEGDALRFHALKLALRAHLQLPRALERVVALLPDPATHALLLEVALALKGEAVGRFLVAQAGTVRSREKLAALLSHAAREAAASELPALVALVRERFADERPTQLALLKALLTAADARGVVPDPALASFAEALVAPVLARPEALAPPWRVLPVAGVGKSANPWCLETRRSADGQSAPFLSSLPRGEQRTGRLVSPPFAAPVRLAFWMAGHNDEPEKPAIPFNKVEVRRAADGALLASALPPRNDLAQRFELDLAAHAGETVVLELVDGNPYDAYAWLAVGRFEPPLVPWPAHDPAAASDELVDSCAIAARFRSEGGERPLRTLLTALLRSPSAEPVVRAAAARARIAATASAAPAGAAASALPVALADLLDDPDAPAELREPLAAALASGEAAALEAIAALAVERCASRAQLAVAIAWAQSDGGARALLAQVGDGKASAALLQKPALREVLQATAARGGEAASAALAEQLATLRRGLPADDEARGKRIAALRRSFARHGGDAARGAAHFARNCASCHAVGGVGATIGPQLDGIGARGFERLFEDLLAPNWNVDPKFVRTNLFLASGEVRSVLVRHRDANVLTIVDERGVEQVLPRSDVSHERASRFSLMPDNFGELLDDAALRDLVAWLMTAGR